MRRDRRSEAAAAARGPARAGATPALALLVVLAAGAAACGPADAVHRSDTETEPVGRAGATAAPATVVDSIRPIDEELRRFRASLPSEPAGLAGGASSIEALVSAFVDAVNRRDDEVLKRLAVDRGEFAYFHYPYTRYTTPPYELAPALVWFRLTNRSSRGLTRVMQTFEHRELTVDPAGTRCDAPEPAGEGRLHECALRVRDAGGDWVRVRLFGRVLERDGIFKILSYGNDLGA